MSATIYTAETDYTADTNQVAQTTQSDKLDAGGETNRDRLEALANGLRARLARTLETLEQRRHDALNVKVQIERHPVPFALAGAGVLAAVAGGTSLAIYKSRQRARARNLLPERLSAAAQAFKNPAAARHPDERSLTGQIARGVVASLATYALSRVAKRLLDELLPSAQKPAPKEA